MAYFDLPLSALHTYHPPSTAQADFEPFWRATLTEAATQPLEVQMAPLDLPTNQHRLFRATYAGWGGAPIVGTFATPPGNGPFPALAMYHGYASVRPDPLTLLSWTAQGYAILAIDTRGQSGESSDTARYSGGHVPGYLTLGIDDPQQHYYRGAYIDAVRALDVLAAQPMVDASRLGVTGASQGGGLTIAAAALAALSNDTPYTLRAAMAEIAFLCHFDRVATLVDSAPYREIGDYCRRHGADDAQVLRTLSYVDCMNLASYVNVPTLMSAGLMDMICPPSTIFATYNAIDAEKEMIAVPFGEHETFPGVPEARARWFARFLRP